jgi:predicted tellurium resistance membrane protein TerC
MSSAVIVAVLIMLFASNPVANFVQQHPTVKMLALAFLLLIGMVLVADGMGFHVPKGFVYAAMGFSVAVESLNLLARK